MQFSLRSLFLLILVAAILVALAKAFPPFRGLMLGTALSYAALAALATLIHLSLARDRVLFPVLLVPVAVVFYVAAAAGTVVILLGLVMAGLAAAF